MALGAIMYMERFTHEAYKEEYIKNENLREIFENLQGQVCEEESNNQTDYSLQDGLINKLGKLWMCKGERR